MREEVLNKLSGAVVKALPSLDDFAAQDWASDKEELRKILKSALDVPQPRDGRIFELTIVPFPAIDLVRIDGNNPERWTFVGEEIKEPQTKRFKLVRIGWENMGLNALSYVISSLKKHGRIPQGQWREPLRKAFPDAQRKGPIGIADPSWIRPRCRRAEFPIIHLNGRTSLKWMGVCFSERWRWLVEVD